MSPDANNKPDVLDVLIAPTRRFFLSLLGAGVLSGGLLLSTEPEPIAAGKKKRKKKKNKRKKKGGKGGGKLTCSRSVVGSASPSEQDALLQKINNFRQDNGVNVPLARQSALESAATVHSRDMATRCYFDHTNPDGQDPFDRMIAAGYTGDPVSENIYVGSGKFTSAAEAFEAWRTSKDGHREAMLDPDINEIGIGTAQDVAGNMFWTNVFGLGATG